MALKIDSSKARRNYDSLKELVEAIRDCADPAAEHHAVEWKSRGDLNASAGQFAVARAILGMANRPVDAAARHFDGLGYVIVGVEAGGILGAQALDGQVLAPKMIKYLGGDGPVWHHDNIDIDGLNVIVFTVEAPRAGDSVHTLRKAYSGEKGGPCGEDGAIFVRDSAQTRGANSSDVRALVSRQIGVGQDPLDVSVQVLSPVTAILLDVSPPAIEAMVSRRKVLVSARDGQEMPDIHSIEFQMTRATINSAYEREISDYLRAWSVVAPTVFQELVWSRSKDDQALLSVSNTGEEAIIGVQVTLRFPTGMEPQFESIDLDLPDVPLRIKPLISFAAGVRLATFRSVADSAPRLVKTGSHWEAVFNFASLHAGVEAPLDGFSVFQAGSEIGDATVRLTITAENRKGRAVHELPVTRLSRLSPRDAGLA